MPPKKRKERPSEDVHTHTHTFSIAHITGQPVNVNDPIMTYVDRSSLDNRRRYEAEIAFEPPSPIKRFRQGQVQLAPPPQIPAGSGHAFNLDFDFDSGRYEMGLDGNDADDEDEGARRRERATRAPKIVKPSVSARYTRETGSL
jgi:hypothetical protein